MMKICKNCRNFRSKKKSQKSIQNQEFKKNKNVIPKNVCHLRHLFDSNEHFLKVDRSFSKNFTSFVSS